MKSLFKLTVIPAFKEFSSPAFRFRLFDFYQIYVD